MKQTSSHTHTLKSRRDKEHLEIIDRDDQPSKVSGISRIEEEDEGFLPGDIEAELELNLEKYS